MLLSATYTGHALKFDCMYSACFRKDINAGACLLSTQIKYVLSIILYLDTLVSLGFTNMIDYRID